MIDDYAENARDISFPFIDENTDVQVIAALMLKMNAFISIETAEKITTLDKTTQYRERIKGNFPQLVNLTSQGRRKAYRVQDLKRWFDNPESFSQS